MVKMLKAKYQVIFQVSEFYNSENSDIVIGQISASGIIASRNDPALCFLKKFFAARS